MPYRIKDGEIECDTPEEVRALVGAKTSSNGRGDGRAIKRSSAAKAAVSQSWKKAKALAKKEGITVFEARSKLAKAKAK
jgi:hypothetical protein